MPEARVMVACDSTWVEFKAFPDMSNRTLSSPLMYRVDNVIRRSTIIPYHIDTYSAQYQIQLGRNREFLSHLIAGSELHLSFVWFGGIQSLYNWSLSGSGAAIRNSCSP